MIKIHMEYVSALPAFTNPLNGPINLVQVGAGGTGSWLFPAVAQIARLRQERGQETRVVLFDPDQVGPENLYRQNFAPAEVGRNKAQTLAFRYGLSWGLEIEVYPVPFTSEHGKNCVRSGNPTVFIGCVDGAPGRRAIHDALTKHIDSWSVGRHNHWWLDCGNSRHSGQILLGNATGLPRSAFTQNPGYCPYLPLPSVQHPELLEDQPEAVEPAAEEENLSCAELALRNAQGMSINRRIAGDAADYLLRMCVTHDLRKFRTYIDLSAGSARSDYTAPKSVRAAFKGH